MRKSTLILLLCSALSAGAEQAGNYPINEPLKLMDGSYLFINEGGSMRMVDKTGNPIQMKDGVAMALQDGTFIIMENKKILRHEHRKIHK